MDGFESAHNECDTLDLFRGAFNSFILNETIFFK